MESFTTPTPTYLQQASLDILYYESHEWQEEVNLMQDERRSLHKLLRKHQEKLLPEGQRKNVTAIQERIKKISAHIKQLKILIHEHEQYLSTIIQNVSV